MNELQTGIAWQVTVGRGEPGPGHRDDGTTTSEALLQRLMASATREAAREATGRALCEYWAWLRAADRDARRELTDRLRQAIEQGRTGLRAWVPVILGDTDFDLVRAAVHAYVDARPVSLERLEQRHADALDWIRRGLALNRAAIFAALLDGADESLLSRLACLRGVMSAAEAQAVREACAGLPGDEVREFLDEWRAIHG